MKPCDRGRGNIVLFIKATVKVIQFIGKTSVGSGSILVRRLVVGFGLQTLPDVLRDVGGDIFLKLVLMVFSALHILLSCICLCTHRVSPVACVLCKY